MWCQLLSTKWSSLRFKRELLLAAYVSFALLCLFQKTYLRDKANEWFLNIQLHQLCNAKSFLFFSSFVQKCHTQFLCPTLLLQQIFWHIIHTCRVCHTRVRISYQFFSVFQHVFEDFCFFSPGGDRVFFQFLCFECLHSKIYTLLQYLSIPFWHIYKH